MQRRDLSVVFLIFNRPEHTRRVFEAIRAAKPERLLIVADGPRPDRAGEAELCARARAVVAEVDWPCQVLREFSDVNLGCGRRVSSGIDWALGHVEQAIILEDDCLPDPTFFLYSAELLDRYRADERIMMISGDNFQNGAVRTPDSYYFSRWSRAWGWATWRRAWRLYDFGLQDWPRRRNSGWLQATLKDGEFARHLSPLFDRTRAGEIDTWDYQWMFCLLANDGLSIVPQVNLVTNIGFGSAATHTREIDPRRLVASQAMTFPLRHPRVVAACEPADDFEKRYVYRVNRFAVLNRIMRGLRAWTKPIRPSLEASGIAALLRAMVRRTGR